MTLADRPTVEPVARRFTRDEYYQMYNLGFFQNQRVELIDGEIIYMSPQNNPHAIALAAINRWLHKSLGDDFTIRCQSPLVASNRTEPEPDFAVIAGPLESQREHPHSGLLVIEVSDTTLRYDRRKASLYASAQVPEYWILNLVKRQLEVHRHPIADEEAAFGFKYAEVVTLEADQEVKPLELPIDAVLVSKLLPAV